MIIQSPILQLGILKKFNLKEPLQISLLLVIAPLIANLIFNEIFSISSKQIGKQKDKLISKKNNWVEKGKDLEKEQIKKSKEKSKARDLSKSYRKEWKTYLKKASIDFSNNQEIVDELDGEIALEFVESYVKQITPDTNTFLPTNDENV